MLLILLRCFHFRLILPFLLCHSSNVADPSLMLMNFGGQIVSDFFPLLPWPNLILQQLLHCLWCLWNVFDVGNNITEKLVLCTHCYATGKPYPEVLNLVTPPPWMLPLLLDVTTPPWCCHSSSMLPLLLNVAIPPSMLPLLLLCWWYFTNFGNPSSVMLLLLQHCCSSFNVVTPFSCCPSSLNIDTKSMLPLLWWIDVSAPSQY